MHTLIPIDRSATKVVRRLNFDAPMRDRFRADPDATLADAGLNETQIEAVKDGDALALRTAGIDVRRLDRPTLAARVRSRVLPVLAASLAIVGMAAGPASAAGRSGRAIRARRFGRRHIRVRARRLRTLEVRAIRTFGIRTHRSVRAYLPAGRGGDCDIKCIGLEILP